MEQLIQVKKAVMSLSGMTEESFQLSSDYWYERSFTKGDLFNNYKSVCTELGYIVDGTFRSYIVDQESGDEKNVFFYSTNGLLTAYKSFVKQIPCNYYTEALTEAHIVCINILDLNKLYKKSHEWECFGRVVAEMAANIVIDRVESFLLKSPEERYVELIESYPELQQNVPLYHISSYLGIQSPSLSRIRKRLSS